jgi:hypothetical protein
VPEGAPELAVGDRLQAGGFLHRDGFTDVAVLDLLQLLSGDFLVLEAFPGLLQFGRAQQAADVVGAERRLVHGSSLQWEAAQEHLARDMRRTS